MLQESQDLIAEADELHAFLHTLADEDWGRPTGFLRWTPWDVVSHLHYFDRVSLVALEGEDAFAGRRDQLLRDIGSGLSNAEIARREFGDLAPAELLQTWRETCRDMATQLGTSDAKRRLPWYGPDMGVRMFTTARLMETWAHGQEIYDLMRVQRKPTDRLLHIATIGVKTFAWTFVNRGLEVPGPPPYVRLVAPSSAIWEWNEPSETECVRGDALDFCHVVTQGRNVADTALDAVGDVAHRWMSIAQCFAGGPADPPKAGERTGS
ncbi:MAG: TIGR03084 family metal-binding protein [Proteobacteria bacterium]|nr:TIGR03084 family metal-binding protein [Pseudomonadota bacterium]